jgi:hypothetical protein
MAAEAVSWWVGVPAHAHAIAAGYSARTGDLDAARRELDVVLALDDWRTDRSYLWSIFIGEMATAAIARDDREICQQLLEDLIPLAETCAVNAAMVCFMGAHAHRVGLLCAALDQPEPARTWLHQVLQIHRRLGPGQVRASRVAELPASPASRRLPRSGGKPTCIEFCWPRRRIACILVMVLLATAVAGEATPHRPTGGGTWRVRTGCWIDAVVHVGRATVTYARRA